MQYLPEALIYKLMHLHETAYPKKNTVFINASLLAERNESLARSKSAFKNTIPSTSPNLNSIKALFEIKLTALCTYLQVRM